MKHVDDAQLKQLMFAEEDSADCQTTAAHVETCDACQSRLADLAGGAAFDHDTSQLLSDYSSEKPERPKPTDGPNLSFLSPPSHPEMLGRLGRYEVERIIGSGGMGIVLKAFDTELNRPVAVKVLAEHLAYSGAARQRFAREAKAAAAVVHEHVVAIHNVETELNSPFLVMQYVAGESVQTRIDREGPPDVRELLRIGSQVASGLAAAHAQGVVHRDVKPANILIEPGVERTLLTDFGLARTVDDASLTQTGVIAGTPHYMSPEQANGQPTDHRTDLFSLGVVLYFLATGHPPFRAERAMGVLNRICHDTHKPLWQVTEHVPDELSVLVDRLLEKQPSKRPASAQAVADQLTEILANQQHSRKRVRRHLHRLWLRYPRKVIAVCGGLLVVCMAAISVRHWPGSVPSAGPESSSASELDSSAISSVTETNDDDEALAIGRVPKHGDEIAQRVDEDRLPDTASNKAAGSREESSSDVDLMQVLDGAESSGFANTMNEIRQRLERLNEPGVDLVPSDFVPSDFVERGPSEMEMISEQLDQLANEE